MLPLHAGRFGGVAFSPAGAVIYSGPGDVDSGWTIWWSCARAYSAAYATALGASCDLVDQAGANPITINFLSNGLINVAAISTWVTAHSVTTIKVTKVYDHTGNSNHATNVTLATMPTLTLSALNSLPSITFVNANNSVLTGPTIAQAEPYSMSAVYIRTGTVTTNSAFLGSAGATVFIGGGSVANTGVIADSGLLSQTANDNAFHALQGLMNSASSANNVDGTDITGNPGSLSTSGTMRLGRSNGAVSVDGKLMEAGFKPSATTATTRGNMYTNQHTGYGAAF